MDDSVAGSTSSANNVTCTVPVKPQNFDARLDGDEWRKTEPSLFRGFSGEPAAYTMKDDDLLAVNDLQWGEIWDEHLKFRETALKKCTWGERYLEAVHAKMRLIMLERRLRSLEEAYLPPQQCL